MRDSFLDINNNLKSTSMKSICMTKQDEKVQKIENNLTTEIKNLPNFKDEIIAEAADSQKKSKIEDWSGFLPSKIESGNNSESIHLFIIDKKNTEIDINEKSKNIVDLDKNLENQANKRKENFSICSNSKKQNQELNDSTVKNSNFNKFVDIYKDKSTLFKMNDPSRKKPDQFVNCEKSKIELKPSNSSYNLDERISRINEKMETFQNARYIQNKNLNLDSRVFSVNDISDLEGSKILKQKSFLSMNN